MTMMRTETELTQPAKDHCFGCLELADVEEEQGAFVRDEVLRFDLRALDRQPLYSRVWVGSTGGKTARIAAQWIVFNVARAQTLGVGGRK